MRKLAIGLVGTLALWVAALAVFGWLGADCQRRKAEDRLAAKMRAKVSIGRLDLGLVTGAIGLDDLRIERDARGLFRLRVKRVDLDVLPLGLSLVQDGIGDVRVRGVDLEVTALGALDLRGGGKRKPLAFDSLEIRDADLAIEATSMLPGLARVSVHIDRAVAGPTTLRTSLSWLFALRELEATVALPGGMTAQLRYAKGVLHLSGRLVGGTPIDLPFDIPVLDPARELEQLAELGLRLGQRLVEEAAERWLRRDTPIVPPPAESR